MVAGHLTCGGVSRGTEYVNCKLSNDMHSERNLMFHNCLAMFHSTFLKQQGFGTKTVLVAKFMAPAVSKLLLKYILLIRPLERYWASIVYPDTPPHLFDSHLFIIKGKQVNATGFARSMFNLTTIHLHHGFRLLDWHQMSDRKSVV